MATIYQFTKPLNSKFRSFKIGDLLFREKHPSIKRRFLFYPKDGGYAILDNGDLPIKNKIKLLKKTNHPKEYYIQKKYTQEDVDRVTKNLIR